jgi:hypothetical protein
MMRLLRRWRARRCAGRTLHERRGDSVEYAFTREDREAQLADLERLCEQLAVLYESGGEPWTAQAFRSRATKARHLSTQGWSQADLTDLGGRFPWGGWWLEPRAADYDARREPWQEEAARLYPLAKAVADDLRSVATLYRRR